MSDNFNLSELHCKGTDCGCTQTLVDSKLVDYLQQIRNHFGVPVTINSGYRCIAHNSSVNGSPNSRHTKGQAADISVSGVAPAEVAKYAESIGILGIGLYETAADGYFVHIDTRTTKSFWYGQGQANRSTFGGNPENDDCNNSTCACNHGLICEYSTQFDEITSYTKENDAANTYIVMCSINRTSPFYEVVLDKNVCKAMGNAYTVRIGNSDSFISMSVMETNETVVFSVMNTGDSTAHIVHITAYQ